MYVEDKSVDYYILFFDEVFFNNVFSWNISIYGDMSM